MTYTRPARPRGVTLTLLNLDGVLEHVRRETPDIPADNDVKIGWGPWAYGRDADGTLIAVCQEGVGYKLYDGSDLPLEIYVSRPGHIAIMPRFTVYLTEDEVLALPTSGEVDLADHVRTFGDRLEQNFDRLFYALKAA